MKTDLKLDKALGIADLAVYLSDVNKQLLAQLDTDNSTIIKPVKRLLKVSGKQLRPSLVIACSMINDRSVNSKAIKLASAVELVHIASLIHDDIIDEAAIRRGVPTISAIEGVDHAIIIGDYMLAKACSQAAVADLTAGKIVAQTIADLCDGQSRELADKANQNRSVNSYFKSIDGKTASLIANACQLGGLSAGLNSRQQQA